MKSRNNLYIHLYILKNVKYAIIYKINLLICNLDPINRIYIVIGYINLVALKKYAVIKHPISVNFYVLYLYIYIDI